MSYPEPRRDPPEVARAEQRERAAGRAAQRPRPSYVPTLYKARQVPAKQAVCAICVERTRGRTERLDLGYGVRVWLCEAHASAAFQTQRSGRDFVLTLQRLWDAHGCLTRNRSRALDAHVERLRAQARATRRPGSYAWPALRREAERRFAAGGSLAAVARQMRDALAAAPAQPPSRRTLQRWRHERRWLHLLAAPP